MKADNRLIGTKIFTAKMSVVPACRPIGGQVKSIGEGT